MWIYVKDRLPDVNTRYAGEFGASVLFFDAEEFKESGSHTPYICIYDFEKAEFLMQASGLNDPVYGDWMPIYVSHWMELPEIPSME